MITSDSPLHVRAAILTFVILTLPMPARADFLADTRRTFQTDIPHFFQDDIPCAFGGQPTSHTRTSCKSANHPAKQVPAKAGDRGGTPSNKAKEVQKVPAGSDR